MFNLIFVDDEFIIRNGIKKCVPWKENGFDLVGLFENGQLAYDYIKNNPVDVVITDINMPHMDGLVLSSVLAEEYPKIMVLLLSGYDDFEYAQKAVKNHVREFLLKPITADELSVALEVVKKELLLSRNQELLQEEMKEKLKISFPLLKERFFNRLISGRLTQDNYNRRREYFKWADLEQFYQVSVIGVPESWNELERITLREYLRGSIETHDEIFFNTDENLVLLVQSDEKKKLAEITRKYLEDTFRFVGSQDKEQISTGCGEIVSNSKEISGSYFGAKNAFDYTKVLGLSQILSIKDVRSSKKIRPETFCVYLADIIEQLKEGSKDQTITKIDDLFTYMEQHYISHDEAFSYYSRINHALDVFIQEMGLYSENDVIFSTHTLRYRTLEQAKKAFKNYVADIEKKIDNRRNDIIVSRIDNAKAIISKRFSESNFSLQCICDELYLSTSQFSYLFKEGTGQTFVEYLTSYRVEEAKKMLKLTDHKVYEIAENIGYQDPRYFSLIFKKQTGVTALEYRKRLEH
ncbi:MAG: response regulator [Spirochaetaceae bacterium]